MGILVFSLTHRGSTFVLVRVHTCIGAYVYYIDSRHSVPGNPLHLKRKQKPSKE